MTEWNRGDLCWVEAVPGHWREAKFLRDIGAGYAEVQVQGFANKYKVTRRLVNIKEVNPNESGNNE